MPTYDSQLVFEKLDHLIEIMTLHIMARPSCGCLVVLVPYSCCSCRPFIFRRRRGRRFRRDPCRGRRRHRGGRRRLRGRRRGVVVVYFW